MAPPLAFCSFPSPYFLFFSDNVPHLVYYSHFSVLCAAAVLALFVLFVGWKNLPNRILASMLFFFILWVFLDSIFWASNRSDVIMFVWSLQILFEPLVHIGALYLMYVLVNKKDASLRAKFFIFFLYSPILFLASTKYTLSGFDLTSCLSVEGPIALYFTYSLEAIITLLTVVLAVRSYQSATTITKKEITYLATGIILFLLCFSWGNIVSSFTENWNYAQIGLFALPVFIGFLTYSIVRFQTFHIKMVGSFVLVAVLWLLVFSLLFLATNTIGFRVTLVTLLFTTFFGALLIRSVRNEIHRREEVSTLANSLQSANIRLRELDSQKTLFLSIASHQLRTPLSIAKGYLELLLDGAYGKTSGEMKKVLGDLDESNERLVKLVDDFLNITRIEQGRTKYSFADFDLVVLVESVFKELSKKAADGGLTLARESSGVVMVYADEEKIRHVVFNFVDNAIKYSETGEIRLVITQNEQGTEVRVKDHGIGFGPVDQASFFQKFYRGHNVEGSNVTGTGLGIYVCKRFIEKQGGAVWAKSAGLGKGSEFGFLLPKKEVALNQENILKKQDAEYAAQNGEGEASVGIQQK